MPTFEYEAVDNKGRAKKGTIEAKSSQDASEQLRTKGFVPTTVSQKGGRGSVRKKAGGGEDGGRQKSMAFGGVSKKDLTMFTRQFATLVDAGLPMVRAMDIMEQMLRPGGLKNAIMDVRDEVEGGSSLSDSMSKNPKAFDELYTSMVKAGEMSGLLGKILNRLADFMEKSQKLKKAIIGALIYPAAVLSVAGGILALIIIVIVPKFKKMFDGMGIEMPVMTQFLLDLSDLLIEYWFLLLLGPPGALGLLFGIRKIPAGRYMIDLIMLYLPVFGQITKKSSISRFCRTLGELSAAGVPLLDALTIIQTAVGNRVVEEAVGDITAGIREGESIAEPMKRANIFDIMVVNMVAVGEETGELDSMLIRIADQYDNDVDTLVGSMMSLLEPFLIIGLGLAVGFIVIALFLPIIKIIEGM